MNAKLLLLKQNVRQDLEALDRIYEALSDQPLPKDASQEALIVASYWLNNLYNAVENIFHNIAKTFENQLNSEAGWHAELLQRMRLDLQPIRPAVIDRKLYDLLDELRRFRHLFRSAYSIELDAERLSLVHAKALAARTLIDDQVEGFLTALDLSIALPP